MKFTAEHRIPSNGNLLENFMPSKQRRGDCWQVLCLHIWLKESSNLCIGRACKRFLNDKGGLPTYLEMGCLEQKIGVSDRILKWGRSDKDKFPIKNVIWGPLKLISLQGSRWKCPRCSEVRSLFEHVKKKDRQHLYDNFTCKMFMDE